jgi:peptide-methionine (R)-S-oxide reductase
MADKVVKTDEEWRKILSPQEFHVLREKGTERAFTGEYYQSHDRAMYVCAACGNELFDSETKYDSGSGWPSFTRPAAQTSVETETDDTHGMSRTEVTCNRCGGHLGHVFPDGPRDAGGLRYCINSASIKAKPPG